MNPDDKMALNSWKHTLYFRPMYRSKATGEVSLSLSHLCENEHCLTLTQNGFSEIEVVPIRERVEPDYHHITELLPEADWTLEESAWELLKCVEKYFIEWWDPSQPHFIYSSGGVDSRIIAYTLANLRERLGKDWLGDVVFYCLKPEQDIFRKVMQELGWDSSQCHVHKEYQPLCADYWGYSRFDRNMNALCPSARAWVVPDVLLHGHERRYVCVCGENGSEILDYPLRSNWVENRFDGLDNNASVSKLWGILQVTWKEILTPYVSYDFLDTAFRIPQKHYHFVNRLGQLVAAVRAKMLEILGDNIEIYCDHPQFQKHLIHQFNLSQEGREHMMDRWSRSKLYRDFSFKPFVKDAKPWEGPFRSLGSHLYSYASMYEHVRNTETIEKK